MSQLMLPTLFPEADIKAKLATFWDDQIGSGGITTDPFSVGACLDSLTACVALLDVEEILNIGDLPQTLVKKNGYDSKEEFIEHLSERTKDFFAGAHAV